MDYARKKVICHGLSRETFPHQDSPNTLLATLFTPQASPHPALDVARLGQGRRIIDIYAVDER